MNADDIDELLTYTRRLELKIDELNNDVFNLARVIANSEGSTPERVLSRYKTRPDAPSQA